MDSIVLGFGTALIGAVATDSWQEAKDAVTGLWRRLRPSQADAVGAELDSLREEFLRARRDGDTDTERALEEAWQVRAQQLLRLAPSLAVELGRVLETALTPALPAAEQARVQAIITGTASGHARLNQAACNANVVSGDQYNAGRDQHIHQ